MSMMTDENDTRYVKTSKRLTKPKSDHAHAYVRIVSQAKLRRFDGTITTELHRISLRASCLDCGYQPRRTPKDAVEVEVTLAEFRELRA